jgi:hypothetical protein
MHTLKTTRLLACACLLSMGLKAQTLENGNAANLTVLSRSACQPGSLEKLFRASGEISVRISPGMLIRGMLISRTNPNPATVSLNIRLDDSLGSVFTIAKTKFANGTFHYSGHILRLHGSQVWSLVEEDDQYYFERMEQRLLIAE